MKPVMGKWLVLVCCTFAAAAAVQDNVLRFLSHKEVVSMAQETQQKHSEEQAPKKIADPVKDVVCPGGKFECPDGSTCCQRSSGDWACCPQAKAVCCSDHLHCCPNGYKCDVATGSCNHSLSQTSLPWKTKTPAVQSVETVICPDHKSQCPDGTTCCKESTGEYGCCPYPNAVCCQDGTHCCPHGSTCDVPHQTCKTGDYFIPWAEKLPARQRVESVVCPGGSECPDGNTCCKLPSGQYGCCPLPDAVCCSDGNHCCPNGYTCNLAKQTCDHGQSSIPLVKKVPALFSAQDIVCPDQSQCPTGNTCCKLISGGYGCCPLPNAVCCSDGVHCCPTGSVCNVAQGTCNTDQYSIPMVKKVPAIQSVQDIICPDQSQCPSGNTCCKLISGGYGCCPLPNAVCCSDGVHCCPTGSVCNVAQGTCDTDQYSIPMVKKVPAIQSVQDIVCPDQSSCPSGNTCCKLSSGNYGCCPLPNAVCCSDGTHCCPAGYTCNVAKGSCEKGPYSLALMKKVSAVQSLP